MSLSELFSSRIKESRESLGITQEEMAQRLGTHRNTYVRYENGIGVDLHIAEKIAEILGIPVSELTSNAQRSPVTKMDKLVADLRRLDGNDVAMEVVASVIAPFLKHLK